MRITSDRTLQMQMRTQSAPAIHVQGEEAFQEYKTCAYALLRLLDRGPPSPRLPLAAAAPPLPFHPALPPPPS